MDGMTPRQLGLSSFAALAAPMTVLCAALPWPAALLGLAVGGVGFQVLCSAADHGVRMAAPLRGAYLLWCLLLLGRAMDMSSLCYPSQTDYVPVVLLALAITAAYAGAGTCGRLGAVLWPALAVLLGGLLAFALSDVRWARVAASRAEMDGWVMGAAMGLSLSVVWVIVHGRADGRCVRWGYWMAAALGLATAAVAGGMLGRLQGVVARPLYDMARGITVLGVPQRLEALLSAALCMGFFLTLSLLCTCASTLVKPWMKGRESWAGLCVGAAALALWKPASELPDELWLVLALGLGILAPAIGAFPSVGKKRKKAKKALDNRHEA